MSHSLLLACHLLQLCCRESRSTFGPLPWPSATEHLLVFHVVLFAVVGEATAVSWDTSIENNPDSGTLNQTMALALSVSCWLSGSYGLF